MILSSEIRGKDGETVLDGGLTKMLASGGDEVEAHKLYNNAKGFVPQFTIFICCNSFFSTNPIDATENLEQFDYKSKFVSADELIEGVSYLKLKDDTVKKLISEDSIIDAYTLYILNAYKAVRDKTPEAIRTAIMVSKPDEKLTAEQFILKRFKTTQDRNDKLHTEDICMKLKTAGYCESGIAIGKIMTRIGIGMHLHNCTIDGVKRAGYTHIHFIEEPDAENVPVEDDHFDDDIN